MIKPVLMAALMAAALCGCGPSGPVTMHMTKTMFGCQSRAFLDRFDKKLARGEKEDAMDTLRQALGAGECVELNKGDKVTIVGAGIGLYRVQPDGHETSYWTGAEVLGP